MKDDELHLEIEDVRRLQEDLHALLRDGDDAQRGWQIHYAVDFAEIHAYILPEGRLPLRLFRDDNELIQHTVQENALHRILFEGRPVLLPPYFLELDSFLNNIHPGSFGRIAVSAQAVVERARAIAALPEFETARAAVEGLDGSEENVQALRSFIEQHADLVAAMKSFDATTSAKRLTRILGEGRLRDFDEIAGSTVMPDEDVYKRWKEVLSRKRGDARDGTNRLDALAIALLKRANELVAEKKIKFLLITRSRYMHELMQAELATGQWTEPPLRHPRCFGVFIEPDENVAHRVTSLRHLLASVEAFLEAASPSLAGKATRRNEDDPVGVRLQNLKDDWRRALELATIARKTAASDIPGDGIEDLVLLVDVINRNKRIRHVLRDLSRELYEEIPKSYQLLGLLVQGRGAEMRKLFEEDVSNIEASPEPDAVVLSSTRDNVPYRLEFYTDELRNWGALFSGKPDWDEITSFFVKALESEAGDYEVLLALAYLLCATGNWLATEKYCRLALEEPDAKRAPHEGLFLLAFVLRRQPADFKRYQESLKMIDLAIHSKQRSKHDAPDPRYLKEKATLLVLWWSNYRKSGSVAFPSPAISEPFALMMFEEALAHPDADDDLKSQIYNNLAMVMLKRGDDESRSKARVYIDHLKELKDLDGQPWRGSALILDTMIWGGWKLGEYRQEDELRIQIAKLQRAANARGISPAEREQVRDHIREMKSTLSSTA